MSNVFSYPWETAQPLYNRVIAVHRVKTTAGATGSNVGLGGYSGQEQTTVVTDAEGETVLFTGLPANIQGRNSPRTKGPLPADVVYKATWIIYVPAYAIAQYSIRDRDIIIDDEQYRYAVETNYWSILGYKLSCMRLEA